MNYIAAYACITWIWFCFKYYNNKTQQIRSLKKQKKNSFIILIFFIDLGIQWWEVCPDLIYKYNSKTHTFKVLLLCTIFTIIASKTRFTGAGARNIITVSGVCSYTATCPGTVCTVCCVAAFCQITIYCGIKKKELEISN